jgi:FMN hydrolase / 5-amino-6-(5-phospho-D-ribitylamino)uracil phosphatase
MNDIQALTFDLDNTLWETDLSILNAEDIMRRHLEDLSPAAWMADFSLEAFRAVRAAVVAEQPDIAHNLTVVRRTTLIRWFESQGASISEATDLAGEGFRIFYHARQQVEPYPGAVETIEALASRYPLGAITNGNADLLAMPIGRHFQFSYKAEDFPAPKPHPVMFEAALDALGVRPEQCLHVGDDIGHDIEGARAAGMRTAWVNTRGLDHSEGQHADLVIREVRDLLTHLPIRQPD